MIDLIQRLWTFTMSCCISSAVCCVLLTASMSGIALGYNYSLAEYIDLKETNVSIYLKRGVFDDEIADDMNFRRSGRMPVAGHIGDKDLITGPSFDEGGTTLRSGRRLDDSIYESDDRNKFEGSLMRLTAKVPDPVTSSERVTYKDHMAEIESKYSPGSLDQLKAVQSLINMKKSNAARPENARRMQGSTEAINEKYLPHFPEYPHPNNDGRRLMPPGPGEYERPSNSLRDAVPDPSINSALKWQLPKMVPDHFGDARPTYPPPVTPRLGPMRPSRPKPTRVRPTQNAIVEKINTKSQQMNTKTLEEELDAYKEKLLLDKFDIPGVKSDEFLNRAKGSGIKSEDEYDELSKGTPIRKRRYAKAKVKYEMKNKLGAHETDTKVQIGKVESNFEVATNTKVTKSLLSLIGNILETFKANNSTVPHRLKARDIDK